MKVLIVDYSISTHERLEEMLFETKNILYLHQDISYSEAIMLYKKINPNFVQLGVCGGSNNSFQIKEIKKHALKKYVIILAVADGSYVQDPANSHGTYFFFDKYSEFEKVSLKLASVLHPGCKNIKSGESKMSLSI